MTFGTGLPPFIRLQFEADEQAALNGTSTGGAPSSGAGFQNKVYVGSKPEKVTKGVRGRSFVMPARDETKSVQDALYDFYNWSDSEYNSFVSKLRRLGYIKADQAATPPVVQALYESAVYGASKWYANSRGTAKVTVDQYLNWFAKKSEPTGPQVSKTITSYTPQQVQGWINEGLMKDAGRTYDSLSQAEKDVFNQAVEEYAKSVTVTRTRVNQAGETVTEVMPSPSAEQLVKEKVAEVGQATLASDYERQVRMNFNNWLSKNVEGI